MRNSKLYDIYTKNLENHWPEFAGRFICPLCTNIYDRSDFDNGVVTKEHVISSKLGGRMTTLTCKTCNSTHGRDQDAKLIERLRFEDQITGHHSQPLRIRVDVRGERFTADARIASDGVSINALPQYSDPQAYQAAIEALSSGAPSFSISSILRYNERQVAGALVRAAYLLMFRTFGYSYVVHPNAGLVRAYINDPISSPWRTGIFVVPEPQKKNVIGLLYTPPSLRCFIAMLSLKVAGSDVERNLMVILPGLGDDGDDNICERWANMTPDEATSFLLRLDMFDAHPSVLTDPRYRYVGQHVWEGEKEEAATSWDIR